MSRFLFLSFKTACSLSAFSFSKDSSLSLCCWIALNLPSSKTVVIPFPVLRSYFLPLGSPSGGFCAFFVAKAASSLRISAISRIKISIASRSRFALVLACSKLALAAAILSALDLSNLSITGPSTNLSMPPSNPTDGGRVGFWASAKAVSALATSADFSARALAKAIRASCS